MSEIGFKIHGKFYPLIPRDDWLIHETRVARRVAGQPFERLIAEGDHLMLNISFATTAWWRANPMASEDDVFNAIGTLKPGDIEWIGGVTEDDARPPDETAGDSGSGSTDPSSESTPEKSDPPTSGTPDSPTGSTSGPQSQSGDSPTAS